MQTSWKNKTQRRPPTDISGNNIPWKANTSEALESFLNAGVNDAYKRPWHRLERGLRLNRLTLFVEEEKKRSSLTDVESKDLTVLLLKTFDKKLLNSKSNVNYDPEKERILEIKGLISHRNAEGRMLFQIIEKKSNSITFRRGRSETKETNSSPTNL